MKTRLLVIRFSSFGDIAQCLGVPQAFRHQYPEAEVHWVTRDDFAALVKLNAAVDCVWELRRRDGLRGLFQLARALNALGFSHVYDAHSNLRSHVLSALLRSRHFVRRSKERWKRFLLFRWRRNLFPEPFRAQESFLRPLRRFGLATVAATPITLQFSAATREKVEALLAGTTQFVALAPSAAWELKRWPVDHWKAFIAENPATNFVVLGGPADTFCDELVPTHAAKRVLNLAGRTTLIETCAVIARARLVVSADTGALHVADLMGRPTIALIGPTAFGYPSLRTSRVLETRLFCKPCSKDGRGTCVNPEFKKCMTDVSPRLVSETMRDVLGAPP